MKASEYRSKSDDELKDEIAELKQQLFKLRFQHATKQLENTAQLKEARRNLARAHTIIRERELGSDKV